MGTAAALASVVAAGAALTGCVERKLIVRSDPPGAILYLEDEQVAGQTPVEVPFEWDGVRRVRLQAPGHHVLETTAAIDARWYDWFPLDVFAQFLYPGTISDVRMFDYQLEPYVDRKATPAELEEQHATLDALKERADAYRAGGSEGPGNTAVAAQPQAEGPAPAPGAGATPPAGAGPKSPPPAKVDLPPPVPAVPRPKPPAPQPPEPEQEPQKPVKPGEPLPPPKKPGR